MPERRFLSTKLSSRFWISVSYNLDPLFFSPLCTISGNIMKVWKGSSPNFKTNYYFRKLVQSYNRNLGTIPKGLETETYFETCTNLMMKIFCENCNFLRCLSCKKHHQRCFARFLMTSR